MKYQARWIIALLAAIDTISGRSPGAWAQASGNAAVYHSYVGEGVLFIVTVIPVRFVLRVSKRGRIDEVAGVVFFLRSGTRMPVRGAFYPQTNRLRAEIRAKNDVPIDGTYDPVHDQINLRTQYMMATLNRSEAPYLEGVWKWWSGAYSGTFRIVRQDMQRGDILGRFSGSTPQDTGAISGDVTGSQVVFKRSGTYQGKHFEQRWTGKLINGGQEMQGNVEQGEPSPWSSTFTAQLVAE